MVTGLKAQEVAHLVMGMAEAAAESKRLNPNIGRVRCLIARWLCSNRLSAYRRLQCVTRGPNSSRIAPGYQPWQSEVTWRGLRLLIIRVERKKARAAARSHVSLRRTSSKFPS